MGGWFLPRRRNSQFFGQFTGFRTAFTIVQAKSSQKWQNHIFSEKIEPFIFGLGHHVWCEYERFDS